MARTSSVSSWWQHPNGGVVVGAYVPPSDLDTVEYITQAFGAMPRAISPILLGDLNVDLANPRDGRGQEIAAELASLGLEDL